MSVSPVTPLEIVPPPEIWRVLDSDSGKPLVLPPLNAAALAAARQLLKAETIGDILRTPFPIAIAPLTQPLTPFADHFHDLAFGEGALRADLNRNGEVSNSRKLAGEPQPIEPLKALAEPIAQTTVYNNAFAGSHPWKTQIFGYRSDLMRHGVAMHTDQPEAGPADLIGLAVSSNPTWVVPHKAALEILGKSPFAPVLDYRLDDPALQEKMTAFNDVLLNRPSRDPVVLNVRKQLAEAMVESRHGISMS